MGRTLSGRSLKRVSGDAYLAPVLLDTNRPITSGAPLQRCSNETNISQARNERCPPTAPLKKVSTIRGSAEGNGNESSSGISFRVKGVTTAARREVVRESLSSSLDNEYRHSTVFSTSTTSEKYLVPTNTAITPTATKSKSSVVVNTQSTNVPDRIRSPDVKCSLHQNQDHYPIIKAYRAPQSFRTSSTSTKDNGFPLEDYIRSQIRKSPTSSERLLLKNCNCGVITSNERSCTTCHTTTTEDQNEQEIESTPVEDIMIQTASSSLKLPMSSRNILMVPSSEEFGVTNRVATALPTGSGAIEENDSLPLLCEVNSTNKQAVESESSENTDIASDTTASYKSAPIQVGDGDTIKTPEGDIVSEANNFSIVPAVLPPRTSPRTSASAADKSGFLITFRKPKVMPRPRSIVTNLSSNRGSLPTTASTPNSISPVTIITLPNEELKQENSMDEGDDFNNNNSNDENVDLYDTNQNLAVVYHSRDEICTKELSAEKLMKSALSLKDNAIENKYIVEAMPAEITFQSTAPQPDNEEGEQVYEPEPDASFWHSDSSASAKAKRGDFKLTDGKPVGTKKTDDTRGGTNSKVFKGQHLHSENTESMFLESAEEINSKASKAAPPTPTTLSESKAASSLKVSHTSKSYDPYGYNYNSHRTRTPAQSEGPFISTEKGAIRFHLPGRIQHKTTIKVAHFPTGDDKNLILNLKPDKGEEEPVEDLALQNCANNQNFIIPPPYTSYPYNPYNMYGGGSPYSMENYYRYYGYPPYYS